LLSEIFLTYAYLFITVQSYYIVINRPAALYVYWVQWDDIWAHFYMTLYYCTLCEVKKNQQSFKPSCLISVIHNCITTTYLQLCICRQYDNNGRWTRTGIKRTSWFYWGRYTTS